MNAALGDREPKAASIYVEQQIYDAFFSDEDQELMFSFHNAEWENRFCRLFPRLACRLCTN
jgi:exonuclease I